MTKEVLSTPTVRRRWLKFHATLLALTSLYVSISGLEVDIHARAGQPEEYECPNCSERSILPVPADGVAVAIPCPRCGEPRLTPLGRP